MASNLLKFTPQTTLKISNHPSNPFIHKTHFSSLPILLQRHSHLSFSTQNPLHHKPNTISLSLKTDLSFTPPTTKEEAIQQAKACLSTSLEKPLNNPRLASSKLKKQKQPKFRVEIPVLDESSESLTQLALQLFADLRIRKKGAPVKILLLWPNPTLTELAVQATESKSLPNSVANSDLKDDSKGVFLNSADVAIFITPESSQLDAIKATCNEFYPKPVVVFNPKWGFEEESGFGELCGFVGSFEVVYSFMGLEVRGILSKRRGVVFRCVKDGGFGEGWVVLVEEEKGELKVVSRFKKRPLIGEVENVLYNLMAVNSPVTKSVKFVRDLVSNVTGKKENK
ncbi:plant/protein (DUF1995) [Tasmannia lanceolata]|uniref:plant/protein (DUF1995) n=1 Tax=Tasmannia lanceolata TaxID=3420 RepID=UPI004062D5B7